LFRVNTPARRHILPRCHFLVFAIEPVAEPAAALAAGIGLQPALVGDRQLAPTLTVLRVHVLPLVIQRLPFHPTRGLNASVTMGQFAHDVRPHRKGTGGAGEAGTLVVVASKPYNGGYSGTETGKPAVA